MRALVAWSPVLIVVVVALLTSVNLTGGPGRLLFLAGVLVAAAGVAVAVAVYSPSRGLADRIAGTQLVMR